jgi:hypothetical protein
MVININESISNDKLINQDSNDKLINKTKWIKTTISKDYIRQAPFLSFQTESYEASVDCHQVFSWTTWKPLKSSQYQTKKQNSLL